MNPLTAVLITLASLGASLGIGGYTGALLLGFAAGASVTPIFWKQGSGAEVSILLVSSSLLLRSEIPAMLLWLTLAGVGSVLMADAWHGIPRWMRALSWATVVGSAALLVSEGGLLPCLLAGLGGLTAGAAMLALHERTPRREPTLRTGNLAPR